MEKALLVDRKFKQALRLFEQANAVRMWGGVHSGTPQTGGDSDSGSNEGDNSDSDSSSDRFCPPLLHTAGHDGTALREVCRITCYPIAVPTHAVPASAATWSRAAPRRASIECQPSADIPSPLRCTRHAQPL